MIKSNKSVLFDALTQAQGKIGINLFNYHSNGGVLVFNFHPVELPAVKEAKENTVQIEGLNYVLCGSQIQLTIDQATFDARTAELTCTDGIACQIECEAYNLLKEALDNGETIVFGLKSNDFE